MKKQRGIFFSFAVRAALCAAMTAVIFTFAGCPTDGSDNGGGNSIPSGSLGDTLSISGEQVYIEAENEDGFGPPTYTNETGNKTVTVHGATAEKAEITGGKLTLTITTAPASLQPVSSMTTGLGEMYDNVTATPADAKGTSLSLEVDGHTLSKTNSTGSQSSSSITGIDESVMYLYVDKDLTITGKGKTTTENFGIAFTTTTNNFTLNLKKGWNAIYTKENFSMTQSAMTATVTMSLGNPGLKWTYTTSD